MPNQLPELDLNLLGSGMDKLSPVIGSTMALAASVCLTEEKHKPGVAMSICSHNDEHVTYSLAFEPPAEVDRSSLADEIEATAWGATGVAILTVRELTGMTVVRRSVIGTGFDWWLGNPGDSLFQDAARLEISGIRRSGESAIKSRLKTKLAQPQRSDATGLPAYAAVVEFSRPTTRIAQR